DEKKGGASIDAASAFSDLGVFQSNQNINNEIEVLKGKSLMYRVLSELNLETTFFTEGNIKTTELYGRTLPINITVSSIDSAAFGKMIDIRIKDNNSFAVIDEGGEQSYKFGSQVKTPYAVFTLTATERLKPNKVISVRFNDLHKLAL